MDKYNYKLPNGRILLTSSDSKIEFNKKDFPVFANLKIEKQTEARGPMAASKKEGK